MNKKLLILVSLAIFLGGFVTIALASNSWSKYHWDKSTEESIANPLVLGNNLTSVAWNSSLAEASSDWNLSVLKNQAVVGNNTNCDPVLGQVEVCNDTYGNNNWLGITQVWVYRGKAGHIAQGLVKMNDTYFNTPTYNTSAWRNLVVCQEVGHTIGLSHQDENFDNANLGTCMDYTSNPESNQHPNQHDYDELTEKYGHLNGIEETKGGGNGNNGKKPKKAIGPSNVDLNNPSAWGQVVRHDAQGKPSLYSRNLGNGYELFTFVTWVE